MKEQEASGLFLGENFSFQGISIIGIDRPRYKMNEIVSYKATTATSDKALHDKIFNIDKNPKYDGYRCALHQWFLCFSTKKFGLVLLKLELCQTSNKHKKDTNQILQNPKNGKYNNLLKTIYKVLISKICN